MRGDLRHPVSRSVLESAIRVHRAIGPGLLEGVCAACLAHELRLRDVGFTAGVKLPLVQDGVETYPKLSGLHRGLLINFNDPRLMDGVRRLCL